MKKWYQSKTYWFNLVLAIFGILEANMGLVRENLGDNYGVFFIFIAVVGVTLRGITTQRVEK